DQPQACSGIGAGPDDSDELTNDFKPAVVVLNATRDAVCLQRPKIRNTSDTLKPIQGQDASRRIIGRKEFDCLPKVSPAAAVPARAFAGLKNGWAQTFAPDSCKLAIQGRKTIAGDWHLCVKRYELLRVVASREDLGVAKRVRLPCSEVGPHELNG